MYNYGVVNNAYIIVMKKYDCSLRDWVLKHKDKLPSKFKQILKNANRPNVKKVLEAWIEKMEYEKNGMEKIL